MAVEFFDNFESGLGDWTTTGVIATSTDQACDFTHSLKVTTSTTLGPYALTPPFASSVHNLWQYVSFSFFVGDFADFWQGGLLLNPWIMQWGRADNANPLTAQGIWLESSSNSAADVFGLTGNASYGSLGSLTENSWNSIVTGIITDSVLFQARTQTWVNGATIGLVTQTSLPGSPAGYVLLGDQGETWVGYTQASYYVDIFSYQPTTQLPSVVCPDPDVVTNAPTGVLTTSATFDADVNPEGVASTVAFEYGLTTAYGSTTASQSIGSGSSPVAVTQFVDGLRPGRRYHVRAVRTP